MNDTQTIAYPARSTRRTVPGHFSARAAAGGASAVAVVAVHVAVRTTESTSSPRETCPST